MMKANKLIHLRFGIIKMYAASLNFIQMMVNFRKDKFTILRSRGDVQNSKHQEQYTEFFKNSSENRIGRSNFMLKFSYEVTDGHISIPNDGAHTFIMNI